MNVHKIEHIEKEGTIETAALIGDERVWFQYPEDYANKSRAGDAFFCAALLPAMKAKQSLEIEVPVSKALLGEISEFVETYSQWFE